MKLILALILALVSANAYSTSYWASAGNLSQSNTDYVYALTSNRDNNVFASSWAVGIYKGNSGQWNLSGLSGKRISDLFTSPTGVIYGFSKTTSVTYIHRSTDNGATWQDVYTRNFANNYAAGGGMVFCADGSIVAAYSVTVGPTVGDVGTYVFKSTDNGNTWVQKFLFTSGFVGGMKLLADGRILMGTSLAGVKQSTNNGESWTTLGTFPAIYIHNIMQGPDGEIYVCDAYGPNRSLDNGASFTAVSPLVSGNMIEASFVDSQGNIFISYNHTNIYRSTNKGNTWQLINEGLPGTSFVCSFTELNGKVYAGTNNSGLLYFTDNVTGIVNNEIVKGFELKQNYPNPFNPSTKINFSLEKNSFVALKVYDASGKMTAELVNDFKAAGEHSINFDASNLPAGVYFYKLEADGFTSTKKMILTK